MNMPRGSWTVFNIPPSHYHCQLHNFAWERAPHVHDVVLEFLEKVMQEKAPHLVLLGPPGTGKSHLLYGIYRWAVLQENLMVTHALHVPSFCDRVKGLFDSGLDPFDEVKPSKFLIALDDIFGRELSNYDLRTTIPKVLEIVNHNRAALVATTNYTVDELTDILAPHEADRLLERATVVEVQGESYRLSDA